MEELTASTTWISSPVPPIDRSGALLFSASLMFFLFDVCLYVSLVDGIPYAQGTGSEKGEAREAAARNCYMLLRS